ncbi:MAG TPA: AAA family ATPase [Patescibacteria group bacterium]|nr:AAA family ATPase [Patescibacteria group bacterium]
MICGACGAENRPGRKFCRSCGVAMAAACPACGAANDPADRFCGECGAAIGGEGRGVGGAASSRAPSLGSAPAAAGTRIATERRLVSVLFADLVGFTTLADDSDPEAVREFLGRYFDVAREVVERYGGAVEKFIGDAVMAVWGTPTAREDDAERAVRAGLDLVAAAPGLPAPGGARPQARAAVLTGEAAAVVGAQGQGMVAGDLVNTASRLQAAAPPGTVLVGEATRRAAGEAIVFEAAGEQILRGKAAPVPAWRAVRVVAGRRGAGRSSRVEPPFVGRDEELQLLKDLLHATSRDGRARLASIVGMAGIGKSRLAWELEKYVDGVAADIYWHRGRSPAYGEGLAFWALGEMVRERAGIAESDAAAVSREKLAATLREYVADEAERAWMEPRLAALLGLEAAPTGEREEFEAACRTLFERISERGTVVLVFEELQWADPALLDFIESITDRSRARPILVVTLSRPDLLERRPTWGAGLRSFSNLPMDPLSPDEVEMLLVGLAPGLPASAIAAIVERAEGIPLYAVEMVRMLLDQGVLREREGRYHLAGELGPLAIPGTLAGLLGSRLDGLTEPERVLIGHGAVLGHSFTVQALAAATGHSPELLAVTLDVLVRKEILDLDEDPRSPERGQYHFVQVLIREVAYERLAKRDRLARHLAAARYFEDLEDPELAGIVTTHYLEAHRLSPEGAERDQIAAKARTTLLDAAARSRDLHAYAGAQRFLEQALEFATDPADEREILARLARAAFDGSKERAEFDRAEGFARRALDASRAAGDPAATARSYTTLASILASNNHGREARDILRQAVDELSGRAPDPEMVSLEAELGRAYLMSGEPALALPVVEGALVRAEATAQLESIVELLVSRAWAVTSAGRPTEALVLLRGVVPFCDEHGFLNARMRCAMNLSAGEVVDNPRRAMAAALEGLAIARRRRLADWAGALAGNWAGGAFEVGEWDSILALAADLDAEGLLPADESALIFGGVYLVRAYRGAADEAADAFEAAFGPGIDDFQIRRTYHDLFAHLRFLSGDLDGMRRHAVELLSTREMNPYDVIPAARAALWLRDSAGMREVLGERIVSLGRATDLRFAAIRAGLAALEGRSEDARAAYMAAEAGLRELGIRFELGRALLEHAVFLAGDESAAEAAEEARAIFAELGATTLLARLPAQAAPVTPATPAVGPAVAPALPAPN